MNDVTKKKTEVGATDKLDAYVTSLLKLRMSGGDQTVYTFLSNCGDDLWKDGGIMRVKNNIHIYLGTAGSIHNCGGGAHGLRDLLGPKLLPGFESLLISMMQAGAITVKRSGGGRLWDCTAVIPIPKEFLT